MKLIYGLAVCVVSLFFIISCTGKLETEKLTIEKADGKKVTVVAEMARTANEREHGFMERKRIPDGTGMLFLFDGDQILSFWMKNTSAPLSIAYIDSTGKIRDVFDMTPFSLENIDSTVRVRYALEVPQGWFYHTGIQAGDTLIMDFKK
jgi:uncharacterized protein